MRNPTSNSASSVGQPEERYRDMSEEKLDILKHDLKGRMKIMKLRGTSGGSAAAKEYNESVVPIPVPIEQDDFPVTWICTSSSQKEQLQEAYFGEEALRIDDSTRQNGWLLRWPYIRGNFNTEGYATSKELLGDIQDIWMDALKTKCGVGEKDLGHYSVVLVVPDLYDDVYLKEMCELLLVTMGFSQVILQQVG